ncbi:MAG TPA: Flp pilus assembly protein CpaB, partial [Paralcaligenes sp.]
LIAAWAARQALQGRILQIESDANVRTVGRVVAAYNLPAGVRLTSEHIAVRQFPATLVSSDSLAPERFAELNDNVLLTPLRAGDLILPVHATRARNDSFSSKLAQGRRAVTMPVDALNSVSGLLEPGDLIDLYVSFEYQRQRITAPLLQGVLVLATGAEHSEDTVSTGAASYSTVTLDTAPEDAIKLVAARQGGTITALLRHPHDNRPTQKAVRGNLASLLGVGASPLSAANRRAPVIYGNRAERSVPGLRPRPATPELAKGVFDLPYIPELVSTSALAPASMPQPFTDVAD